MADASTTVGRFRILTIIDEGNREALAIEIGTSIPSSRVIRVIAELVVLHGRPAALRVDNGPELLAQTFVDWCADRGIAIHYIQLGKPDQNACSGAGTSATHTCTDLSIAAVDQAEPPVSSNCGATGETQEFNRSTAVDVFRRAARLVAPPLTTRREVLARMTPRSNAPRLRDESRLIDRTAAGEFMARASWHGCLKSHVERLAKEPHHGDQQAYALAVTSRLPLPVDTRMGASVSGTLDRLLSVQRELCGLRRGAEVRARSTDEDVVRFAITPGS